MAEITNLNPCGSLNPDLLREANHRIANQLSLLVGTIKAHAGALKRGPEQITRGTAANILDEITARIISLAHLHRRLAETRDSDMIDVSNLLIESCAELNSALALGERVRFRHALEGACPVSAEQASVLSLLLGEIVMNAIKYAHPTGLPVEISIACLIARDGRTCVEISDDGVGLPEGFDERRDGGVGFKIIRSLAAKIGADIAVRSDNLGLSFSILLPSRERPAANVIVLHPQTSAHATA